MPRIETDANTRIANCLEDICDCMTEMMNKDTVVNVNVPKFQTPGLPAIHVPDQPPPVVNVSAKAPVVNIPAQPTPVVNVAVQEQPKPGSWVFTVHRDGQGFIETIVAEPRSKK